MLAASLLAWLVVSGVGTLDMGADGDGVLRAWEGEVVRVETEGLVVEAPLVTLSGGVLDAPEGAAGSMEDGTEFEADRLVGTTESWVLYGARLRRPGGETVVAARVEGGAEHAIATGAPVVVTTPLGVGEAATLRLVGEADVLLEPGPGQPVVFSSDLGVMVTESPVRVSGPAGARLLSVPGPFKVEHPLAEISGEALTADESGSLEGSGLRMSSPIYGLEAGGESVRVAREGDAWVMRGLGAPLTALKDGWLLEAAVLRARDDGGWEAAGGVSMTWVGEGPPVAPTVPDLEAA